MEEPEYLHGILIYNLPVTKKQAAIVYLQAKIHLSGAITSVIDDKLGLKVFFNEYASACLIVIERYITIENSIYAVYPTVTNLTVHGIRPFLPNADAFRDHIRDWEPIINVYPVKGTIDDSQTFETDDLRVILNVPEVRELLKIPRTVKFSSFNFEVTHFCRLCRKEGHTQFECIYSPGRSPINTEAYQVPNSSGAEIPRGSQGATGVNGVFRDETLYGCFSPIKTPSGYHFNHYQNQSFEPSSSFGTKISPDSCILNKIKSRPSFPNTSFHQNIFLSDVKNNVQNFANSSSVRSDCLREIIQTAKENEHLTRRNHLQGNSLKTAVKHEQISPELPFLDKDTLRQILSTAKQKGEQLSACFGETTQQYRSTEQVKQELSEPLCYRKRDLKPCVIEKNRQQRQRTFPSTEENFIHETPQYQNDMRRVKSNETISSDGYSYGYARRKQSCSEPHASLGTNRYDSKARNHKNWKTSSQENVSTEANHFTLVNKSEKINKKINASTSLIGPNRCSSPHESTIYSDDSFKGNSAEPRKKPHMVETFSPTFGNEFSKPFIGKVSEVSVKTNPSTLYSKCSVGNDAKDISSVKSSSSASPKCSIENASKSISSVSPNTSASSKDSIGKVAKNVSSVKSFSSTSSATKCQNASTSHLIKKNANKKRSFESRSVQDSSSPSKSQVQKKSKKEIRFKILLPPDCNISEECIKSFCREASKSPEAFRRFIRNGSCLLHSEIQKILAFNHVKSKSLNLSERRFIDCLEKSWVKLNHHVKFGAAAADATSESDLLSTRSEPQQEKTSKSFSASQDDELLQDKTSKSISRTQDDGNLSNQKDSGKKRPRLSRSSNSNYLPEIEENRNKLRMVISPGLKNAIKKTKGVLTPDEMQCFLIQVYKRVHCVKIALCFSKDVSAICKQLNAVKNSYYRSRSRTAKDDLNMRIVQSLRNRMQEHSTCKTCMQD